MTKKIFNQTSMSRAISALILTASSMTVMTDANATASIMAANGVSSCTVCHTGGAYSKAEGQAGLKAFCAPGTVSSSFVCVAAKPTAVPTVKPTTAPTAVPTVKPTTAPTAVPTVKPTTAPTTVPTVKPTTVPTVTPTLPPYPTPTPTVKPTPAPTACGTTDDGEQDDSTASKGKSSKVTIFAAAKVSVHAGDPLPLTVLAQDCEGRKVTVKGTKLPKGATVTNSTDSDTQLPKAVVNWTVPVSTTQDQTIVLTAVAADDVSKSMASQAVVVDVLPPLNAPTANDLVKSSPIGSAKFNVKTHAIDLAGQATWVKGSSLAARNGATVVITDANTGAPLGDAAPVASNGKWKVSVPANAGTCTVDASVNGSKPGSKSVAGMANCKK